MIPFVRLLCNAYRVRVCVCYPFGLFEIFFFFNYACCSSKCGTHLLFLPLQQITLDFIYIQYPPPRFLCYFFTHSQPPLGSACALYSYC